MNNKRSRSRSPHKSNSPYDIRDSLSPPPSKSAHTSNADQVIDCKVLHIQKIPRFWDANRVKAFIRQSCKSRTIAEGIKFVFNIKEENKPPACLVKFSNSFICNLALTELIGLELEGKKIDVKFDNENLFAKNNKALRSELYNKKIKQQKTVTSTKPFQQGPKQLSKEHFGNIASKMSDHETYGLSMSFLEALNIKLPLLTKIFIANLDIRVTEAKLREVFGYAGHIMQVTILNTKGDKNRLMAKIEYDHPVEAVQAIAMFQNQELYKRTMTVQMDNAPHLKNLPEGLAGFGPGLGANGEPLRGIRTYIELQPIKKMLMDAVDKVTSTLTPEQALNVNQPVQIDTRLGLNAAITQSAIPQVNISPFAQPNNVLGLNNVLNTQGVQNLQILQSLMQQNPGVDLQAAFATLQSQMGQNFAQNQNAVANRSEWSTQGQSSSRQNEPTQPFYSRTDNFNSFGRQQNFDENRRNFEEPKKQDDRDMQSQMRREHDDVDEKSTLSTDMVVFSNLPSSVNLQALSSKMREVGELKFAEITGQGRAIVRFFSVRDAERCVKLFDRSKVDGQIIEVRFF